ncbi:MAG: SAM-dependent methyltransferase [Polyangiaceae bacterium]|nr:SAM-dependent methyltransferase [Polyangiaceae bacterium]
MSSTRPSTTAALVASTLLLLRDDPAFRGIVDEAARDRIEASVRTTIPAFGAALDRLPWLLVRQLAFAVERIISPGFIGHYALRKHAIRGHLRAATDSGFRQVVLLGAGFDMLASSLPDAALTFEVDLPATQAAKRAACAAPPRTHFVTADLARESLLDALRGTGAFDRHAPTVFVAEGLLMYLAADRVAALLDDVSRASSGGTRVILSVLTPDARGRFRIHSQRRVVDLCMRWLEEPFVWGIERGEIASLLSNHGFRLESITCTTELRDALLPRRARRRIPRRTGELVVVGSGGRAERF